tara:strand:+ start:175 stop:612 length:438 start_codon:yes stop_codon:yes gene_type:complete
MYTKKNGRMTYKSNRRPNFKRNNNYNSKGRNKGNVTQQYNKYLKLAKDTFSSGDRIQAEYYYQFTDHYYRLMLELGLSLEDQELSDDNKAIESENIHIENDKENSKNIKETLEVNNNEEDETEQSIESVPFISEPIKKKRTKNIK